MSSVFETLAVLNTSQPLLAAAIINAMENDTVALKYLKPKGGMDFSKGGYQYDWNINSDVMFQVHAVQERAQTFTPVPNHRTRKASISPATLAIVSTVDKTEAKRATGPSSNFSTEFDWIKNLMKPSVNALMKELEQYLFMGLLLDRRAAAAPDSYNGLICLSPEFTGGTVLGATNGVFDTNTFENQTKTVLNLACDDGYRWASQTSTIAGFGGGVGPAVHKRHLGACRRYKQTARWRGRAFQDEASFRTLDNWVDSRVVWTDKKSALSDMQAEDEMLVFNGIPYHLCYNIDIAQYSNAYLKTGVTFVIDEDQWRGYMPGAEEIAASLGEWKDGMNSGNLTPSNVFVAAGTIDMQMWPEWLASQGVIMGGGS